MEGRLWTMCFIKHPLKVEPKLLMMICVHVHWPDKNREADMGIASTMMVRTQGSVVAGDYDDDGMVYFIVYRLPCLDSV